MSETTDATTDAAPTETVPPPEGEQTKTFDADYVKKLREEAAKYRTEAKANAEAAKRLAEIEEANKTEAQRTADRLAAAEQEAADARREALKFKIASKFQIGDEDADLFLTGSDEESLTRQAERLTAREGERKKNGNHVPREGTTTGEPRADEMREFTRQLFAGGSTP
jgi:membrane protein involved in colicin uptake